ncbi:Alpha/Beta hydrolase protein [Rhypophila decipiens]|uniref:Alpha/Beta hydrolase protein n=1 Tax=Rhypophila decipiens TaxID=261697 RepID=A0AAN7B4N7_9PEZI|nr:Alpha/Beta hydrolase protein [Rhypophila decipiens]
MALNPWTFTPFPPFPATILPNIAFYNATAPSLTNLTYQVTLSYPFEWGLSSDPFSLVPNNSNPTLSVYIPDGNAFSLTAHEFLKRRKPVEPSQPSILSISIGYPLLDSVYDFPQREIDFGAPIPPNPPVAGGSEAFLSFINDGLRPWVQETVFPTVNFTRDAIYGHSSGGLLVAHALAYHLDMFDTFIAASPSLALRNGSIMDELTRQLGDGINLPGELPPVSGNGTEEKPAAFIAYGGYEEYPTRRRTETEPGFQFKKGLLQRSRLGRLSHDLFDKLVASGRMRDVVVKEYPGLDHASVGAAALVEGLVYFMYS